MRRQGGRGKQTRGIFAQNGTVVSPRTRKALPPGAPTAEPLSRPGEDHQEDERGTNRVIADHVSGERGDECDTQRDPDEGEPARKQASGAKRHGAHGDGEQSEAEPGCLGPEDVGDPAIRDVGEKPILLERDQDTPKPPRGNHEHRDGDEAEQPPTTILVERSP